MNRPGHPQSITQYYLIKTQHFIKVIHYCDRMTKWTAWIFSWTVLHYRKVHYRSSAKIKFYWNPTLEKMSCSKTFSVYIEVSREVRFHCILTDASSGDGVTHTGLPSNVRLSSRLHVFRKWICDNSSMLFLEVKHIFWASSYFINVNEYYCIFIIIYYGNISWPTNWA